MPQRDPRANTVIDALAAGLVRVIEASVTTGVSCPQSSEITLDFQADPRLSGPTGTPPESGGAGDVET